MEKDLEWNSMAFHAELNALCGFGGGTLAPANWHRELQTKFVLHPSVKLMVTTHRPASVQQLAIEFPYVSETDPTRIAYTRNHTDGERGRQLVTSVGKYLARHWPDVSDHERRDVQALFTPDRMHFVHTTPEIIRGIELGPRSCMASVYGTIPFSLSDRDQLERWFRNPEGFDEPPWHLHPYSAYKPEFGWSMALRSSGDKIMGRALLLKHEDQNVFLRTYKRHPTDESGWSETDFALHAWLEAQKFVKVDSWPEGARLHAPLFHEDEDKGLFLPYIDGNFKRVKIVGPGIVAITHGTRGDAWCENTSCTPQWEPDEDDEDDDEDEYRYCGDCDSRAYEDDITHVGRHEDQCVCDSCITSYDYVEGINSSGRGTREYYIHKDDAVSVARTDRMIDPEYPPNDVIQLEGGDWADVDDTVCINGDYYLDDDSNIVALEEDDPNTGDSYGLKEDCFKAEDGTWWASEDHYLEHHPVEETTESTS